jgi:hypothetical protein
MHSGGVNKTDTAFAAPNDTIKFTPLFGCGEVKSPIGNPPAMPGRLTEFDL